VCILIRFEPVAVRAFRQRNSANAYLRIGAAPAACAPCVFAVDVALVYPRLERPAAVVPSLGAIGEGRDFSFGDACRALQRIIWNIEGEIVLIEFGFAVCVRLCHGRTSTVEGP
jgi:cytochrome oxidase Cu insertion factor (SCO1/SenC/PrrC family)